MPSYLRRPATIWRTIALSFARRHGKAPVYISNSRMLSDQMPDRIDLGGAPSRSIIKPRAPFFIPDNVVCLAAPETGEFDVLQLDVAA
jgi:hypothetical protein